MPLKSQAEYDSSGKSFKLDEEIIKNDTRTLDEYKELLKKYGTLHFDENGEIIELIQKE